MDIKRIDLKSWAARPKPGASRGHSVTDQAMGRLLYRLRDSRYFRGTLSIAMAPFIPNGRDVGVL